MKPTENQIEKAIEEIRKKLDQLGITKAANFPQKEGYTEAVDILAEDRQTYEGIDKLETVQGRAIAVLAVDFLNGECDQKMLCGVPLK
ncbi:hypothetical protein BWI93_03195 [Siphonobacter sp. BAB-5385]|uniref:hypothetical protein n=1 Tax=Siphonobacter sp. BAB-5385 TaxID=1864822 RepID=UPI000B9E0C65|nr:hypothetical protein [Siphonobacter sp. BAB-5385]OZI09602.1 hypothetical protein BWI93_03195 [Siphonobacter sp. BAB-5385]